MKTFTLDDDKVDNLVDICKDKRVYYQNWLVEIAPYKSGIRDVIGKYINEIDELIRILTGKIS